ncbi:MAG: hypothetical protein DHS20C21_12380 [Gemmatimonadota bacterium]|nr:MAG: hypothetical protein DHS20C21_12380 [Gemmatimonadota bacterium]
MFQTTPEETRVLEAARLQPRFALGAYEFVREAVTYASHVVYATGTHVSGPELLEAIRQLAQERYGALSRDVFRTWGVARTEDLGEIVFRLIGASILAKTEEDSIEDFRDVYDLDTVFDPETYWNDRFGSESSRGAARRSVSVDSRSD